MSGARNAVFSKTLCTACSKYGISSHHVDIGFTLKSFFSATNGHEIVCNYHTLAAVRGFDVLAPFGGIPVAYGRKERTTYIMHGSQQQRIVSLKAQIRVPVELANHAAKLSTAGDL